MARDRSSRPQAKPLRLFVAVDVPEHVRASVQGSARPLRERFPSARWVPIENQHVTLKFLGSTWPRLLEWVIQTVREVAATHATFETRLGALGAFPSTRRARVLWASLEDPASAFEAIATALEQALAREFAPEQRAFTPHLTLARFRPPVDLGQMPPAPEHAPERFGVDRLVLYRSHLRRPAPVYEVVEAFPLGP